VGRPIKCIRVFSHLKRIINEPSFYPHLRRKSLMSRILDNVSWCIKYHEINDWYNLWGIDLKGISGENFLSENVLEHTLMDINGEKGKNKTRYNYVKLLDDKFLFYAIMKGLKLPTAEVIAFYTGTELIYLDGFSQEALFNGGETYFAKAICGSQGKEVQKITSREDLENFMKKWHSNKFILQKAIQQHKELNAINPLAINTIRMVTVADGTAIKVLSAALRCGSKASGCIDNFSSGGGVVLIDKNGRLEKYGLHFKGEPTCQECHPDTGFKFAAYKVPYYNEAVDLAIKAHAFLYASCAIGWDIAITEEGPVIIEGNYHWGLSIMQSKDYQIKDKWQELCNSYSVEMKI
jgi:hypothetical protein